MATQTPTTDPGCPVKRTIHDLSFCRRAARPSGKHKYWNPPKATGEFFADKAIGYALAREYFDYAQADSGGCYDPCTELMLIMNDMPAAKTGIEEAFLLAVARFAIDTTVRAGPPAIRKYFKERIEECREYAEVIRKERLFKKVCRTQMKLRGLKTGTVQPFYQSP